MNPSSVKIPERLQILLGDSELGDAVRLSLKDFERWIRASTGGLFFFPEYTDHGPAHISAVILGADELITTEARELLTQDDAAVLILATLLHDCAMHLTGDGLLDLIRATSESNSTSGILINQLDKKTWPQLFDEFYAEARRWDQRILHRIIGDQEKAIEEEEDLIVHIRHPRERPNPEDWSLRYRKFLGEFVRRHHSRLAHEIAIAGVPGYAADRLKLTRIPEHIADLAGFVARSHNMALRDTFVYLREKYYGRVICSNTHPVFLMVLLRISDYLEFRADRVNRTQIRIQRLRSPVSQGEWSAHLAIEDVRPDEDDSEAIFVVARPSSSRAFLRVRQILAGLQEELDTSWAVLGEVFSRQGALSQFGLNLRRVRSNLDDLAQFVSSERPLYVPVRAAFETAGVDLLKLLVTPLYGERPEIGVRELLQNALDAVYELRQWATENRDPALQAVSLPAQNADVLISIDRIGPRNWWLTVTDKGIGMTAETVRDYFLRAGASYRRSEAWRGIFESEGKAKILRSGRFGIGALAAFLLGNRIDVSTRHVTAAAHEGLRFNASIQDEIVELRWEELQHVGTTIRVRLTEQALKVLRNAKHTSDWTHVDSVRRRHPWDWYVLDEPRVERLLNGKTLPQEYHLPHPGMKEFPLNWRSVVVEGFQAVYWTYSEVPELTCNGIRVESYRHESHRKAQLRRLLGSEVSIIRRPSISVFDRDGRLPLNLQRSEIETGELPFAAELTGDVLADLYAFLLVHGPRNPQWAMRWILSRPLPFEPLTYYQLAIERFWITSEGFSLTFPWHIKKAGLQVGLLAVDAAYGQKALGGTAVPEGDLFFGKSSDANYRGLLAHLLKNHGLVGYRTVVRETAERPYYDSHLKVRRRRINKGLVLEEFGEITHANVDNIPPIAHAARGQSFTELHFDPARIVFSESRLLNFFKEVVDTPVIPFDSGERRRRLPRAFDSLRDYIRVWQSNNLTDWRREMVERMNRSSEPASPQQAPTKG